MASADLDKARGCARIVSIIILGTNFVLLLGAVCFMFYTFGSIFSLLETDSQNNVTLNLDAATESDEEIAWMSLLILAISSVGFIVSVPQILGAGMLFAATHKNTSPDEAAELVDYHQKIQWAILWFMLIAIIVLIVIEIGGCTLPELFLHVEFNVLLISYWILGVVCIIVVAVFEIEIEISATTKEVGVLKV